MTLTERFILIQSWPASRKTALLSGLLLLGTLFNWLITHATLAGGTLIDMALLDRVYAGGTLVFAAFLAIGSAAARAGHIGDWIPYAFVVLFGVYGTCLLQALGFWSTSLTIVVPLAVMISALYYGVRVGWFAFVLSTLAMAGVGVLQTAGVLRYAPALLDRSVEAHQAAGWLIGNAVPGLVAYAVGFALCVLVVAARNLQDVRLRRAQQLIRRYVPVQIAEAIIAGRDIAERHERRKLTIFFSDLVAFTDISEELEPEDLSRLLNEYFSEMTAIAQKHGGTVDELSGDAILIFFGAPHATDDRDHALRAVRMAVEMQQALPALNAKWRAAGITEALRLRTGINTGVVTVGNFGSSDRMKYAALGKHVNLAARIQGHCEPGKVLLSHATWLLVNGEIQCEPKGEMQFKGINKPVATYEVGAA